MTPAPRYVCQACGANQHKWMGRCESCGAWNAIVEEMPRPAALRKIDLNRGRGVEFVKLAGKGRPEPRLASGIGEFDRVCGGGLVSGSAVLVGGDPGIGKSTLVLQLAAALAPQVPCAYISGEESIEQVRLRATRLGLGAAPVGLAAATGVADILTSLDVPDGPRVVVIDSIQTMFLDSLDSAPGTVSQVRASAEALVSLAKRRGFAVLLVGHVTKEGAIAGPKVLEHMVDTVLYFEGERGHPFRVLRAIKNRFGPTDEIGVFEMTDTGLHGVANPSALFLAGRAEETAGAAVFAGIEGTRPMLLEIQALVAPSSLGTPRRAVVGWDAGRLAMVLAVLEARCGVGFAGNDVYLNVAGGLRISEPAADLAIAAALVSARADVPFPADTVVFGEIGLGGEIRSIGQRALRLREAHKMGFARAIAPAEGRAEGRAKGRAGGIELREIAHLRALVEMIDSELIRPRPMRAPAP